MKNLSHFFLPLVISLNSANGSIIGAWESECQNYTDNAEVYSSIKPVDTFTEERTASFRIHVFEKENCRGKEWDLVTIPCNYEVGQATALPRTYELNLVCEVDGQTHKWYEIVELNMTSIRYGNKSGLTPEERPTKLGNVYFSKIAEDRRNGE